MQANTVTITQVDRMLRTNATEPRKAKEGVYEHCDGELDNIEYQGEALNRLSIEEKLLDYFCGREIGYSTWQSFIVYFSNTWNSYFPVLKQNLEHVEDFTVIDAKETVREKVVDIGKGTTTSNGKTKVTDTPNEYLLNPESYNGLTGYTETESTFTGQTENGRGRELETDKGGNAFERWLELSEKNRNMVYSFIKRFEPLFKTTYLF